MSESELDVLGPVDYLVDDLPQVVPLSEAVAGLQPEVAGVAQTWSEIYDGTGCAPDTTTTTTTP